jgi:hypothetical protein
MPKWATFNDNFDNRKCWNLGSYPNGLGNKAPENVLSPVAVRLFDFHIPSRSKMQNFWTQNENFSTESFAVSSAMVLLVAPLLFLKYHESRSLFSESVYKQYECLGCV